MVGGRGEGGRHEHDDVTLSLLGSNALNFNFTIN
jgi:hypothetical protein